tara:strand:- start:32 stop:388 length:357 start_codon:yes stop_codon:yes gene_type:complete
MIKEGKVWGQTSPLVQLPLMELHHIYIEKDGYCSKHSHQSKENLFLVISGKLEVKRWKDYDLIDSTFLHKNDIAIVSAGEDHQFYAHEDTEAYEIYWPQQISFSDIVRESVGGIKNVI